MGLMGTAAFAAPQSTTVKLALNDYVRDRFGHERAVGTTLLRVPPGWTFVRFGRPESPQSLDISR